MDWEKIAYSISTAAAGLAGGLLWLRRKVPADNLGIAVDTATKDLISALTAERNKYAQDAREAWAKRLEDTQEIAALTAENRRLTHEVSNCQMQIAALRVTQERMRSALTALDPRLGAVIDAQDEEKPA